MPTLPALDHDLSQSLELTDYDCRRVPDGVVAWSTWRAALVESAGRLGEEILEWSNQVKYHDHQVVCRFVS